MFGAPSREPQKNCSLTDIHPIDVQRGDAFGGVTVQNHRIAMLHVKRLDFFFGEFWYTWTKAKVPLFLSLFEILPFSPPLIKFFIKYLPSHRLLYPLPLVTAIIYSVLRTNDAFYRQWDISSFSRCTDRSVESQATERWRLTLVCDAQELCLGFILMHLFTRFL